MSATAADLVAPAARVLTVAHRRDPARAANEATNPDGSWRPDAHLGYTMCGLPMLIAEVWIPVNAATAPLHGPCDRPTVPVEEPAMF